MKYWTTVAETGIEFVRISVPADEGTRDVLTIGSVIISSSHLRKPRDGQPNEVQPSGIESYSERSAYWERIPGVD